MRLLLDTQVVYIWVIDDLSIPRPVQEALDDSRNQVSVSAASFWEISIKHKMGKLDWPDGGFDVLHESELRKLHVSPAHGERAGSLPMHHRDPFDRMLVAQAQIEKLVLVGGDAIFERYDVDTLWT